MGNRHRAVSMVFGGSRSKDEEQRTEKSMSDLKSVYKDIRYDWPQLVQGNLTPIEMAIAFLDDTSVGLAHRKADFDDLCEATGQALRAAVVDNHETFNNSVGLYHLLLSITQESQKDSLEIKKLIDASTRDMKDRSAYLKDLDTSTTKFTEMIEILDAMEYLRDIPAQIDQLILEKKIHEVYDVIAQGYKTAAQYNLWSLSAMNATQNYLEMQSNSLYDMIVDELRSEIYLKHFATTETDTSKASWMSMIKSNNPQITALKTLFTQLATLEQYIYNSANLDILEIAGCLTENAEVFLKKQLPKLHAHYAKSDGQKTDYSILIDSALNPTSQSYYYIYRLLHTASKLNRLESVTQVLLNSVQLEIHSLINQTTEETSQRNFHQMARLAKIKQLEAGSAYDNISGQNFNDAAVPIIDDFFATFFMKCLATLLKHKIVSEIVKLIQQTKVISAGPTRDSTIASLSSTYDFQTIWAMLKKEIETLIVNYIYVDTKDEQALKSDGGVTNKIQQVLVKKQLFQFDNVSYESSNRSSDEMREVLNEMFPGFSLNELKASKNIADGPQSPYITSERFSALVEVLVPKHIFNMRIILELFLIFVAGSNRLFVSFDSESTNGAPVRFFHEVMQEAFLTRLREEVDVSFNECMTGDSNKLTDETANGIVKMPFNQAVVSTHDEDLSGTSSFKASGKTQVYLNAVQFRRLFTHACFTMNTSFTYCRDLSDLVLGLLEKFSATYQEYYHELLSSGASHDITELSLGLHDRNQKHTLQIHKWMRIPALVQASGAILQHRDNPQECASLLAKEVELMFYPGTTSTNIFEIAKEDLLDDDWFDQVCYLLLTASWVLTWLPQMKKESSLVSTGSTESDFDTLKRKWSFLENGRSSAAIAERSENVYLTLNQEMAGRFDNVVQKFESIRDNALIALRYDIRLKGVYHIGQSFKDDFVLPTEPADADQYMTLYNKEIYYIGAKVHDVLSPEEEDCVFIGLPEFMNTAFIQGSEMVKVANANGIKKIILNIFTLQQMLRSVIKKEVNVDLSSSSRYFELFTASEQTLLPRLTNSTDKYTRNQLLNLLRLIYSEKLSSNNASSFNKSKYSELVKKVNDIFT